MIAASLSLTRPKRAPRRVTTSMALSRWGWLLFALSMFLPAVHIFGWMYGWQCAWTVLVFAWNILMGGEMVYFASFTLANGVMLASPLLLRGARRSARSKRIAQGMLLAATLWVVAFGFWQGTWRDLGVGYYLWAASFWLVFAGSCRAGARTLPAKQTVPALAPHADTLETPETLAARRELEAFLQMPFHDEAILRTKGSEAVSEYKEASE